MRRFLPVALAILLPFLLIAADAAPAVDRPPLRGVWVSTVYNLDYPSAKGLPADALRAEAIAILDRAVACGLNAVMLQVRPCADSFYPSDVFPWSEYLSGTQGVAPPDGFDPLAFFIEQAHARGVAVHAWCNPYRVSRSAADSKDEALSALAPGHPARENPWLVRLHTDGCLYFDPGLPEARQLVVRGMLEIAQRYDIDGLHIDDYFYPGQEFDDADTYAQYGAAFADVGDFRRANVDLLIGMISEEVRALDRGIVFGVSPFGIWANESAHPLGSNTAGTQSYYDHYADTRKWAQSGLLDYLAPQLYWHNGSSEADYATLLRWWQDALDGTDTALYIGLAAYRMLEEGADPAWQGTAEIERQLDMAGQGAAGFILFRYGSVKNNAAFEAVLRARFGADEGGEGGEGGVEGAAPPVDLVVTRPAGDIRTAYASFYFTGRSDPAAPLTLDGRPVARTENGYFGVLVPLEYGENTITFTNGDRTVTRAVWRYAAQSGADTAGPLARAGDTLRFSCFAARGSRVTALFAGRAVELSGDGRGAYQGRLTVPEDTEDTPCYPLYIAEKHGFWKVSFGKGPDSAVALDSALTATAERESVDVYKYPDAAQGATYFLRAGMSANVARLQNGYAEIEGVGFVRLGDVRLSAGQAARPAVLSGFAYSAAGSRHEITVTADAPVGAVCRHENGVLMLTVTPVSDAPPFDSALFDSVTVELSGGTAVYTLKPRAGFALAGYDVRAAADGFVLVLRERAAPSGGLPLSGLTVMLDAGHGGAASGAVGPDEIRVEKVTNLDTALALRDALVRAGATVLMTRETDIDVPLRDRVLDAYAHMPDVFLSLHSNSAPDNTDISKLTGVQFYARSTLSRPLAECIAAELSARGRTVGKISADSLLYVVRGEFTLSLLLENEFIPNPAGFELITSETARAAYCDAIVAGLAAYFGTGR